MKEHSTININIINLDASSQLYRLCISILIGFLPCDVRHLVSLQVDLYQAKEWETWHDYYLGEREWECERERVRVRDRDGEREREWYFRELLLLLGLLLDLCLLQKYIYHWTNRKIQVHFKTMFWSTAKNTKGIHLIIYHNMAYFTLS